MGGSDLQHPTVDQVELADETAIGAELKSTTKIDQTPSTQRKLSVLHTTTKHRQPNHTSA
jgi:hypothetical protein